MANLSVIEKSNIEGVMMGLMRELEKLAPHPDLPEEKGPIFSKIDSQHKPAAEYDGMLGSLVLESFLGTAFAEASTAQSGSWSQTFSNLTAYASDVADVTEELSEESYNLGQKKSISAQFNQRALWQNMMNAYLKDLPKRLGIERWLSDYQRKLYALQKHAYIPAP